MEFTTAAVARTAERYPLFRERHAGHRRLQYARSGIQPDAALGTRLQQAGTRRIVLAGVPFGIAGSTNALRVASS